MKLVIYICLFVWFSSATANAASHARSVREGNQLFEKGDYTASIDKYSQVLKKKPESDIVNFDIGTAYYKNKAYSKAIEHLHKSLLSEDESLKKNAYYNLGNSLYKFGIDREKEDIDAAIDALEQALSQYESALKLDSKDADAQYNYEFVKKELERLKKVRQRQQQQQQQQQSQQPQQDQQQQDRQQSQQQQRKQEQGQQNQSQLDDRSQQEPELSQRSINSLSGNQGKMTKEQAQKLLEYYQQTEEPNGLLNLHKTQFVDQPVFKDW